LGLHACEKSGSSSLRGNPRSYCVLVFVLGPFVARGGIRGKKSTPSVGMGGTSDVFMISKQRKGRSARLEGHLHYAKFISSGIFLYIMNSFIL
jgi:hypothetical protein